MNRISMIVAAVAIFFLTSSGRAQQSTAKTVDRLYVLDCGQGHAPDESRWTVGVNI